MTKKALLPKIFHISYTRTFGMRHLLRACVFVPVPFYTILLPKAEAKANDFSVQLNNENRTPSKKNEKQMINHAHTYQEKRYF